MLSMFLYPSSPDIYSLLSTVTQMTKEKYYTLLHILLLFSVIILFKHLQLPVTTEFGYYKYTIWKVYFQNDFFFHESFTPFLFQIQSTFITICGNLQFNNFVSHEFLIAFCGADISFKMFVGISTHSLTALYRSYKLWHDFIYSNYLRTYEVGKSIRMVSGTFQFLQEIIKW